MVPNAAEIDQPLIVRQISRSDIGIFRDYEDLVNAMRHKLAPQLKDCDAIVVERGVIDRRLFPMNRLSVVKGGADAALFHVHEPVCLVAKKEPSSSTLLCPLGPAAQAVAERALSRQWNKKMETLFSLNGLSPQFPWAIHHLAVGVKQSCAESIAQALLDVALHIRETCNHGDGAYGFLRDIQQSLSASIQEISWQEWDIGIIKRRYHARNVRERNKRHDADQLRHLPVKYWG